MHRYSHDNVLLVFEDEEAIGSWVSLQRDDRLRVSTARNGLSGVEKFCRAIVRDEAFDVVVAQYDMTVLTGLDVLRRIRSIAPQTRTVLFVRAGGYSSLIEKLAWSDFIVTQPVQVTALLQGTSQGAQ